MPEPGITRSVNGCLTCKNRKKKCDETRPICTRCTNGDFECLGYDYLDIPRGPRRRKKKVPAGPGQVLSASNSVAGNISVATSPGLLADNPRYAASFDHPLITTLTRLDFMVHTPRINPLDPDHIIQMFLSHAQQNPASVQPFKSPTFPIIDAVAGRMKRSSLTIKLAYAQVKIGRAIRDGAALSVGIGVIDDFQRQVTNITRIPEMSFTDLTTHLECLFSLSSAMMYIINTPVAYSLVRKGVPFFLALVAKCQELWVDDFSISIRHVLAHSSFELIHFVFFDTISAVIFGIVPLIHYDAALPTVHSPGAAYIEWAHGCSSIVITLLAKVNSWRAVRFANPSHPAPSPEELREFQDCLQRWNTTMEYGDQPTFVMGRLAIQEIWRHAVLIYMLMGMCEADSADPRVEASVRQVALLSATVETNHPLEVHMPIPCIIAAAAARKEKHRAILRKKISASRDEKICLVRGIDFVLVLDHLWHGAAAGGRPVTWQDYVDSRFAVLPVGL